MVKKPLTRKVLIITYYWPPAGGPGVQRVLKFTKYLPEFGWEPVILTVENGEYPASDESLLEEIPDGIKVYRTKALEPYQLYKFLSGQKGNSKIDNYVLKNKNPGLMARLFKWIRFNLFIPDARMGWIPFAIRHGMKILKDENIEVILSSSPPHSLQLTGLRLARKSKIPWVADFRDPWSSIVYYQDEGRMAISARIDTILERRVLKYADRVITVSREISKDLNKIGKRKDTEIIHNGYDAADFDLIGQPNASDKIIITYAGFLSDTRIPHTLLNVLSSNPDSIFDQIEFHIYGKTSPGFDEQIRKDKITHKVVNHGYIDHGKLVSKLTASDALLMVVDNVSDNKGILTGKLFDYMGTKKPIIALGPHDGEVKKIIQETSSGWYISYGDDDKMSHCLTELTTGDFNFKFYTQEFDRKNLTRRLAKVLDEVVRS